MYTREEYLQKIDRRHIRISDLIKYCIKKWKLFLLFSGGSFLIILTFILVVYSQKESEVPQMWRMEDLTGEQRERVTTALKLYQELEEMDTYKRESDFMGLNALDCNVTTLQYVIVPEDESASSELYELYANCIKNGKLNVALDERFGEQIKFPADLVMLVEQVILEDLPVLNRHVLCIKIVHSDSQKSEEIAEVVKQEIEDYQTELMVNFDKHSLKLVSQDSYRGVDYDVKDRQDYIIDSCEEKRQELLYIEELLSTEEKSVLEAEKNGTDSQEPEILKSSIFSWIFVVIALFASMIIACGIIIIYYVYCNRIKFQSDIIELFDIPFLGEISEKMDDGKIEVFAKELELYCSGLEIRTVFLSQLNNDEMKILESVKKIIEKCGITLILGGNICESFGMLEESVECRNLILIYQLDKTTYRELDSVFQKCECYGINVIGGICEV